MTAKLNGAEVFDWAKQALELAIKAAQAIHILSAVRFVINFANP